MAEAPVLDPYLGRIHDVDSHLQVAMRRYPELMGESGERIYRRFKDFAGNSDYAKLLDPEEGEEPGKFIAPHGIAVDSRGDIYAADVQRQGLQVFRRGG